MSASIPGDLPVIDMTATGRQIRRLRQTARLSVREVSAALGLAEQAVYKWQRGESLPTVDNLALLARLLGCSMEELLCFEDQRHEQR